MSTFHFAGSVLTVASCRSGWGNGSYTSSVSISPVGDAEKFAAFLKVFVTHFWKRLLLFDFVVSLLTDFSLNVSSFDSLLTLRALPLRAGGRNSSSSFTPLESSSGGAFLRKDFFASIAALLRSRFERLLFGVFVAVAKVEVAVSYRTGRCVSAACRFSLFWSGSAFRYLLVSKRKLLSWLRKGFGFCEAAAGNLRQIIGGAPRSGIAT